MTLFENVTGAPVKDLIVDNSSSTIYMVVDEGKVGIAIGKNGNNVRNVEKMVGKTIKLFEFSKDTATFVKNLIPQATSIRIRSENDRTIVEIRVDRGDKAMVIGREGRNLKLIRELLQRNHHIDELVVR
jgi:N utilization substance protein A